MVRAATTPNSLSNRVLMHCISASDYVYFMSQMFEYFMALKDIMLEVNVHGFSYLIHRLLDDVF